MRQAGVDELSSRWELVFRKWIKIYFLIFVALSLQNAVAETTDTASATATPATPKGHSVAPLLGYEPTYRFVAGAVYFYEGFGWSTGIDSYTNFGGVYQAHVRLTYEFLQGWRFRCYLQGIKGYDPYYGEGGETNPNSRILLWGYRLLNTFSIDRDLSKLATVSFIADERARGEDSNGAGYWIRQFPDEHTLALGAQFQLDSTDDHKNPKNGFRWAAQVLYVPSMLTLPGQGDFAQFNGSLSVYEGILKEISDSVVAAFYLRGGYMLGNPTYLFKYKLGGSDGLAGYQDNRFRGTKYYAQTTEIRYPIWHLFSGTLSLAFGDTTDTTFTNPKLAYGAGLRVALPPDYVSKIRIDFLYGRDQNGIFVNYGDTF